jgi:hypothetical protein
MTRNRFNLFKAAWEEAYQKYFGKNIQNIIPQTESVAPYEYYKRSVSNAANMVSIDIGGGSSDIIIAEEGNVKYITSFRFAANSVFGDGYAQNATNGIIQHFKKQIFNTLQTAKMDDLLLIYNDLSNKYISTELASFFFSLKENRDVQNNNLSENVDFNKMLQADDKYKILFLFFYASIIYHLAQIMKAKNLLMPRHIAFSGNGSKIIQILTPDGLLLEDFTKIIFEKIYAEKYNDNGLTILQNPVNPKEVTCKGGIFSSAMQNYAQMADKKVVLKSSDNTFVSNETYLEIREHQTQYLKKIVEQAKKFINFVFDLNNDFSFKNNFGIDSQSMEIARSECFKDLETYVSKGFEQKSAEVSASDLVEETMFFYPLNGMLNYLSSVIYENTNP